ncbi:MAG: CARDB domain-containing protein, partial [Candidatus Thermoplasmatota archaeon]|nr:CARDB domain-containing protein [Candidatus Thermoplasmatota archaeon]
TARVTNDGTAGTQDPFTLRVYVDGVLVSTESVAPLAAGETRDIVSDPWTATSGDHEVTLQVDTDAAISETDEGNNEATSTIDVAVGVFDPGYAYEDVNNDALFTQGLDIPIDTAEVLDGAYEVENEAHGLVITPSVGAINAATISFASGDQGHLIALVDVTATTGQLHYEAGTYLNATNVTLQASNDRINVTSLGGQVNVTNATLTANGVLHIRSQGDILVEQASLSGQSEVGDNGGGNGQGNGNKVTICHYPPGNPENHQTTVISQAAVSTHEGHHRDYVEECVDENGIFLHTGQEGHAVLVDGVSVDDPDDTAWVWPGDATIVGLPASGSVEIHVPQPVHED